MKNRRLLSLLSVIAVAMILAGCSKKSNNGDNTKTKNYFEIKDASYVAKAFPTATSDVQIEVNMNNNVLPGGSNYITVASPVEARKIYVGLQGEDGYYELVPEVSAKEIIYDLIMIVDQSLTDEEFTVTIAILDADGNVSTVWNAEIDLITAGTGGLQVSLSFDNAKDVDLHLFEPNGAHIYYGDRMSSNGGYLDVDSNPNCNYDNINNENIFYNDTTAYIEPGEYTVYVDMYNNCDPSVATNFVLTVFYNGALIQTVEGTNPIVGTFPVNEPSNYNNLGNIEPVCHFIIPDYGQKAPAKSPKKLPEFLRSADK